MPRDMMEFEAVRTARWGVRKMAMRKRCARKDTEGVRSIFSYSRLGSSSVLVKVSPQGFALPAFIKVF